MDVELFVYGVPYGEEFWGKKEDKQYFGTLYDGSLDEVKFLIQTRLVNGRLYCYYNYMVYKDVVDNNGRPGSYFGISLRFDAYCKDIINMYRILDTIYNVYVLGSLLKIDKSKLRYIVSSFSSAAETLKSIEDATLQLVQKAFSNDSFTSLSGFSTSGGSCPKCNLYDCTPEIILNTIKQYGKVAVSPYYPSNKETTIQQKCNAQVLAAQQQCEERLQADAKARAKEKNEMSSSLSSAKSQITQLQNAAFQKDNQIKQLEAEISRLKSEIRNIGRTRNIAHIIAPLREPIAELAKAFKGIPTESDSNMVEKTSVIKIIRALLPFVNFIMLILILITVAISLPTNKKNTDNNELMVKIDSLESVNQDLQKQIGIERIGEYGNVADFSGFDIQSVRIDIHGYKGGALLKHTTYEVEAKGGIDGGSWRGEGCIITQTDNPQTVKIVPTESNVKIIYCVGKQEKSRDLTAK